MHDEKPAAAKSSAKMPDSLQKKPAMAKPKKPGSATKTKESVSEKMRAGWKSERRYRSTGQVDVHYISPSGNSFRTLQEARESREWLQRLSGLQRGKTIVQRYSVVS